jgi:hypothetical protein
MLLSRERLNKLKDKFEQCDQIQRFIEEEKANHNDLLFFNVVQEREPKEILDFQFNPNNSLIDESNHLMSYIFPFLQSGKTWNIYLDEWLSLLFKISPMFTIKKDNRYGQLILEGSIYNVNCIKYPSDWLNVKYKTASQAFIFSDDDDAIKLLVFHDED